MWRPRQDSDLRPPSSEPAALSTELRGLGKLVRATGFEPVSWRWQRHIVPFDYARVETNLKLAHPGGFEPPFHNFKG